MEYQIECLKKQNLTDIILVIGHLGNVIENILKTVKGMVQIVLYPGGIPHWDAGALCYLKGVIRRTFFLINGDILFDVDFTLFLEAHRKNHSMATIFTHPNSHPYDSGIIAC